MTDYCKQEYQALQLVFPHTHKYRCSFHRAQAWVRGTRESKNGSLYIYIYIYDGVGMIFKVL